jgi:hypothetical protein
MGGTYTVAGLMEAGVLWLAIVMAAALLIAGLLIKPEGRKRFLLWCAALYMAGWTLFVLYNTVLLTRTLVHLVR